MLTRSHSQRCRAVVLGLLLYAAVDGEALAEFAVGDNLPAFSLSNVEGSTATLEKAEGALRWTLDTETLQPKVVALHLLQPNCLQCRVQLEALQKLHENFASRGLLVVGVAHRGNVEALRKLAGDLKVTFPLLSGTGSELAKQFAAGDTLALVDAGGTVRFAQVGYGHGDEKTWAENIELMLQGQPPAEQGIERERLQVGDRFPSVNLPSLRTGKPLALVGGPDGKILFRDDEGREIRPRAAIGFFSRY